MSANTRHIVVMGVSGSGKSSVAARLAHALGYEAADGDEFHSAASVAKMAAGHPLGDADRAPWLARIAAWIGARDANGASSVVACSALKRRYRAVLRAAAPRICFVHLVVPDGELQRRLRGRTHFMRPELLETQLADLEPLGHDEPGFSIDGAQPLDAIVAELLDRLRQPLPT